MFAGAGALLGSLREKSSIRISLKHERMDVALFTNRRGVSEFCGHSFDRFGNVLFLLSFGVAFLDFPQRHCGQNGAGPGAEIFGCEIAASDLAQIIIHIGRKDFAAFTVVVEVLKKFLAGNVLAAFDDFGEAWVVQFDLVHLAAFAAKFEAHLAAADAHMAIAHRREPERIILFGVFFVADADDAGLENPHNRGKDFLNGQTRLREVPCGALANFLERFGEVDHAIVFVLIADFAPARVIAELFATAIVAPGGLQVTVGISTNPNVSPRGWDCQFADAAEIIFVFDGSTVRSDELEIAAFLFTANAGKFVGNVTEAGFFCGYDRVFSFLHEANMQRKDFAAIRSKRIGRSFAARKRAVLSEAGLSRGRERFGEIEANLFGFVSVGAERERDVELRGHIEDGLARIEFFAILAKTGGVNFDRDIMRGAGF